MVVEQKQEQNGVSVLCEEVVDRVEWLSVHLCIYSIIFVPKDRHTYVEINCGKIKKERKMFPIIFVLI